MHGVFLASLAIFLDFHAAGIIAAILFGGVISLLAVIARKGDYRANIFLFRGHAYSIQSFELTETSLLRQ
jgi:hypothetical protein